MSNTATAVIGSNFGDESKGNYTDYFSAKSNNSLVIRYNGGCQAGHTVVTPQGKRHVFNHFGSGTLNGSDTFLSKYFVLNPLGWSMELDRLQNIGCNAPTLYYDPKAIVTTPYDMIVNQTVERFRNGNRHGSCGWGINETVTRCENSFYRTTLDTEFTKSQVSTLRCYAKMRLSDLGVPETPEFLSMLESDSLLENFLLKVEAFRSQNISRTPSLTFSDQYNNIVFEGAQGLLLDEHHEFYPHVTRSRTGLSNIMQLCRELHIQKLNAVYVTRAYMTRHGAGPFLTEVAGLSYEDKTNVPNEFQGTLRFGHLDLDLLAKTILADYNNNTYAGCPIIVNPDIAVSCLDQVGPNITYKFNGELVTNTVDKFMSDVQTMLEDQIHFFGNILQSSGPTRNDIKEMIRVV